MVYGDQWKPESKIQQDPAGEGLAFIALLDGASPLEQHLVVTDGETEDDRFSLVGVSGFSWSPDGSLILVETYFHPGLGTEPGFRVLSRDGTELNRSVGVDTTDAYSLEVGPGGDRAWFVDRLPPGDDGEVPHGRGLYRMEVADLVPELLEVSGIPSDDDPGPFSVGEVAVLETGDLVLDLVAGGPLESVGRLALVSPDGVFQEWLTAPSSGLGDVTVAPSAGWVTFTTPSSGTRESRVLWALDTAVPNGEVQLLEDTGLAAIVSSDGPHVLSVQFDGLGFDSSIECQPFEPPPTWS